MKVSGNKIWNDIIAGVKQAKFHLVIPDEVTDMASKEELSLSLRLVFDGRDKKVFVAFAQVERVTGQVLAQTIFQWLSTHDLSSSNIRSECYDGTFNMSQAIIGFKSVMQQ